MASLQEISRAVRESAGEGATSTSRRRHRQGNRFFTCSLLPCQNFQDFPLQGGSHAVPPALDKGGVMSPADSKTRSTV